MTHKLRLSHKRRKYKALLYRKNTDLDLDLNLPIQIRDLGQSRKRTSRSTETAAGKLPIHLDLGNAKTINIAIKDIKTTESHHDTEIKGIRKGIEETEEIIMTEMGSMMIDAIEETGAGPEKSREMTETEKKKTLSSKASPSPPKSQCHCPSKSRCHLSPDNEDNAVRDNVPVHL